MRIVPYFSLVEILNCLEEHFFSFGDVMVEGSFVLKLLRYLFGFYPLPQSMEMRAKTIRTIMTKMVRYETQNREIYNFLYQESETSKFLGINASTDSVSTFNDDVLDSVLG